MSPPRVCRRLTIITPVGIKTVHILFITVCSVMSLALGGWRYSAWTDGSAGMGALMQAGASVLFAIGLVVYGVFFMRKLRDIGYMAVAPVGALLVAWPSVAEACATCFGDPDSPLTKGMTAGILVLLGFIGTVLASFASLFLYWMRRHRLNEAAASQGMVL
jgi:hypothetical protein